MTIIIKLKNDNKRIKKLESLKEIYFDFQDTSKSLAKILILERNIPIEFKSLKPRNIGGIAGGVKFIIHGILFKFSQDTYKGQWIYGKTKRSDYLAAKGMNNDLKSLRAIFELINENYENMKTLNIPLMSVTKYLGYTICALSLLPCILNKIDHLILKFSSRK